ncbi:MAG TPA: NACHT domain-containing protein, partial [Gemmata sp.]
MPPESRAVKPKPKPSIWWRPLKIDGWGLFKAAVQVVKSLSAKQYDAAVKDALAVLETVKFKENDAHLAWALVYTAMTKAIANLLRSVRDETSAHVFERFAAQCARLDQELNANETAIDKAFFDHPGWSQYVREVTNKVRAGLIASELDEGSADTIARTLPQQFTLALDREWLRDKERYAKLLPENRRTPFSSAADHEDHWTVYAGWLEDEADRRVFDEDFGLSRVYIPLRAYVETLDRSGPKRTVGLVEEMLDAWLEAARTNDAIRIVEGDPGAGKSSLARRFAATRFGHQAAGQWWRAVYVPLHDEAFALGRSIEEAAAIFTQRVSDTKLVPLDRNAPHGTLLILDGLDELARGGQFGRDTIRAFMSQVTALLKAWNDRDSARLLVLICGRPVAVGEIKAEVRADEAVLNLLPFLVNPVTLPEWSTFPGTCSDPQKLLEADQRKDWYEAYSSARGLTNGAELYAKIQKREDLATVTAQPLLNYLIAFLTREEETGELPANLCGVYEALLHKVWQRRWDRGQVPAIGQMPFEPFCQLLETIALTAWHSGNARSIRVGEVEDHLTDAQKRQLEALEKDVKAGVLRLLFAFFLRPGVADRAGQTYEFTHKTFSEYLVARRLVREIDTLAKDWKESAGGRGWKDESRLQDWVELF